jgi:hypothetical protein
LRTTPEEKSTCKACKDLVRGSGPVSEVPLLAPAQDDLSDGFLNTGEANFYASFFPSDPDNGYYESYSSVRSDLINNATSGDATFNALPNSSSIQGQSNVAVWNAQLKLWGLLGANDTTTDDGSATFATDISGNLLVGVALHELTHAMGRVPYGPPYSSQPDIFDLYRFTSSGVRLIDGHNTAPAAYFSVDGGNTILADFGQYSDPSDFLNGDVQGGSDPFNEYNSGSTLQ